MTAAVAAILVVGFAAAVGLAVSCFALAFGSVDGRWRWVGAGCGGVLAAVSLYVGDWLWTGLYLAIAAGVWLIGGYLRRVEIDADLADMQDGR